MRALAVATGVLAIGVLLWDAFETVVLPRQVSRRVRVATAYYRATWGVWRQASRLLGRWREAALAYYGPLSLVGLAVLWAAGLLVSFALIHWGLDSSLTSTAEPTFGIYLYMSGTTLFTLGFGDVAPLEPAGRALAVIEAATGFGLLAVVISYFPALYQAFSQREVFIAQLDARAGSPPSAGVLLARCWPNRDEIERLLRDSERWASELMESVLSYPALAYFRSQHDRQSWLAGLVLILDTSAFLMSQSDDRLRCTARLSFAMARHAAIDLAHVLNAPPRAAASRLSDDGFARLVSAVAATGVEAPDAEELAGLRADYEPYVAGLAAELGLVVPPWLPEHVEPDDWLTVR